MRPVAVLGATGAIGARFAEIVAGEGRAPIRVLIHRWWHASRAVRFEVELRDARATEDATQADVFAATLAGCDHAVSFIDGPDVDAALAEALIDGCARAGVGRLVHLGCLRSFDAVREGRLDEEIDPPCPPGAVAARRWTFEQSMLRAGQRSGIDVVVVTASLVYGPFTEAGARVPYHQVDRGRVAVSRQSGPCHLVYVDDVIEAVWAAVTAPGLPPGRVFVSGPESVTWPEFYGAFERIVGRPGVVALPDDELRELLRAEPSLQAELRWPPPPRRGRRLVNGIERRVLRRSTAPPRRRLVLPAPEDIAVRTSAVEVPLDRARDVLGWKPVVDFEEGMRRTGAYLRWSDPRADAR